MDLNDLSKLANVGDVNVTEYVTKAVSALQGDSGLMSLFTGDPVKAIEKILGVDLPDGVINQVVKLVQQQLGGAKEDAKDAAKESSGILGGVMDAVKKIF